MLLGAFLVLILLALTICTESVNVNREIFHFVKQSLDTLSSSWDNTLVRETQEDTKMKYEVTRNYRGAFFVDGKKVTRITGKSGGFRYVGVTADGLIFKADIHERCTGWAGDQTEKEIERYQLFDFADRKYFPLILANGSYTSLGTYSWLITPQTEIKLRHKISAHMSKTLRRLERRYDLTDLGSTCVGDRTHVNSNFTVTGTVRFRPLIFDFAL